MWESPPPRFQEDGLRVMRALRLAAAFGYEIEEATARAVHDNRAMLGRVAAERVNVELCKLIVGPNAGEVLRQYPDVLCEFWPELESLVTLQQNNPWHCWDGWKHTIHAMEAAPADLVLRLTMLLHDIGKPVCKSTDERGVDHFYGHPAISAQLTDQILRALKFDNKTRERVVLLAERQCFTLKDLAVDGRDVIAAGIEPGPEVGRVLAGLLERVLTREILNTRETLLVILHNDIVRYNSDDMGNLDRV